MRIYKLMFLLSLLCLSSCQQMIDGYWERKEEESYSSPYKGIYVGNYSGSDEGTLRIEISAKDFVEVTRISRLNGVNETFQGGMIGPAFNQLRSSTSGFTIFGNVISSSQSTYSGTWKIDEGNSGTWTLKKQ